MILKGISEVTAYRMHVPKWAVAPTSGAGAGRHGGRANRIGLNALYLALDVNTAVLEYQQVSPLMPPGTLVSYRLTIDPVADFTSGYQRTRFMPSGDRRDRNRISFPPFAITSSPIIQLGGSMKRSASQRATPLASSEQSAQ
jgi:hypothetical protein